MSAKLLTEHHLQFLTLKGGCRGLSESTHVKVPHCWKSHALAHYFGIIKLQSYVLLMPSNILNMFFFLSGDTIQCSFCVQFPITQLQYIENTR